MELDILKDRWQQRGEPEPHWQKGENMNELRRKLADVRRTARRRDLRETVAALLVAAVFGWAAFTVRQPLARIGSLVVVAAAVFIIIWMRVVGGRNLEPDPGLPVAEFVRRELHYLDRQIHLLRSVFWWYIAPNLAGVVMFFSGASRSRLATGIFLLAVVGLSVVVYRLNQLAARTALVPLREELARSLRELEANGSHG